MKIAILLPYKENFSRLRELKAEVERIQSRLQKQRVRMQKEFEDWYAKATAAEKLCAEVWLYSELSAIRSC